MRGHLPQADSSVDRLRHRFQVVLAPDDEGDLRLPGPPRGADGGGHGHLFPHLGGLAGNANGGRHGHLLPHAVVVLLLPPTRPPRLAVPEYVRGALAESVPGRFPEALLRDGRLRDEIRLVLADFHPVGETPDDGVDRFLKPVGFPPRPHARAVAQRSQDCDRAEEDAPHCGGEKGYHDELFTITDDQWLHVGCSCLAFSRSLLALSIH
mmetsp:Transcript_9217/g.27758  ORF Transcript_9217/g.27758 Transcript_9217/m.27758 type:complete len:209 (-) Transcript_9217:3-629(-)